MLHTEMVCFRGNDRNLYLVISVALPQNPIPNEMTNLCANGLQRDPHMAYLHTLHLRTLSCCLTSHSKKDVLLEICALSLALILFIYAFNFT